MLMPNTASKLFLLRLLPVCAALLIAMPSALADDSLKQFRWQNRLLLIFAPQRSNADFQTIMRASLRRQDGFIERDLLRISVIRGDTSVTVHGTPAPKADHAGLPSPDRLYARYDIDPAHFAALLIGKDGGVKARWSRPVAIDTIFAEIDAMPMRQQEMRNSRESGDNGADDDDDWFGGLKL